MITVLMGAPGAGKSTWIKKNATDEHIFNTEGVRVNREIDIGLYMHTQRLKAVKAVESGKSLIADGTHTIATHRQVWLNLSKRLNLPNRIIVFPVDLQTLLNVQLTREHPAPRNVVVNHYTRLKSAQSLITKEGWDEIIYAQRF
jgi:predicted kinase